MNLLEKIKWITKTRAGKIAMVHKEVEALGLPKGVVPLQKSIPPFMPVENGHGYMGMLLYKVETDEVQCHVCGEWRRSIGAHVSAHKMTAFEYKDKFGLYRNQPLTGLVTRGKYNKIALKRNKRLKKNLTAEGRNNGINKCNDYHKTRKGAKSVQHQNMFGTCEAQLRNRVAEHVAKFGYFPRSTSKEDPNLATMLWRRFGSIENAKKYYSYKN